MKRLFQYNICNTVSGMPTLLYELHFWSWKSIRKLKRDAVTHLEPPATMPSTFKNFDTLSVLRWIETHTSRLYHCLLYTESMHMLSGECFDHWDKKTTQPSDDFLTVLVRVCFSVPVDVCRCSFPISSFSRTKALSISNWPLIEVSKDANADLRAGLALEVSW